MKDYTCRITFVCFGIALAAVAFFGIIESPINGEHVDCYDRFRNIILEEKCVVDGEFDSEKGRLISAIFISILLVVMFYVFGSIIDLASNSFNYYGYYEEKRDSE